MMDRGTMALCVGVAIWTIGIIALYWGINEHAKARRLFRHVRDGADAIHRGVTFAVQGQHIAAAAALERWLDATDIEEAGEV